MTKKSEEKAKKVAPSKAVKPKKAAEPKKEAPKADKRVDKKQVIVGIIILIVAFLLLFFSFYGGTPKRPGISNIPVVEKVDKYRVLPAKIVAQDVDHVVFVFTATTSKPLNYKLYYTTEENQAFDEDHVVPLAGEAGKHTYSIPVPVEKIVKFRLNFGTDIGVVTMGDIYLTGSQTKDLNNLFQYVFFQIVNVDNHGDGSFTFEMIDYHAYMEYNSQL